MAHFITVQNLKDNTAIQNNVESALLFPYVSPSQKLYIRNIILGIAQYEALENEIDLYGLTGLTGTSLALIQKIQPCLEFYTFYTAMPYIQNKFTNKGIVQWEDPTSKAISEEKFDKLRKDALQWAQTEEYELLRFLRANKTSYPLWREGYFTNYEANSGATYHRTFFGGIEFDSGFDWNCE